ncbi:MAG: RagB/SusD family nutrient uptake outer membrane protein, partial [Muribaculaceae bacterium]|nr:RagB/SusD family nutrient uptake outer membrane protein [Muribaculaceae bacterium]
AELAELGAGTIIQDDLDLTINKLQARAGLPAMTTTPAADPANDMGVSNLIWEIRRCRRCELMLDNWYRYWDLIRWHQLDKLDTNKNPDILLGANVSNIPNLEVDVNADGYIIATQNAQRIYNAKYYLYPIPSTQLTLNPNLGQNPNW